jgi:uncharacterized Ntn-hydrolase superfamily protein
MALFALGFGSVALAGAPVHTFSIVARDPATGAFGVAVQSHWFSVGATVPWAEAGVGAVATQSFVEVSFGPRGLELMKKGKSAEEALKTLLASDPARDTRQVALVDRQGRAAAWTGPKCVDHAGHQLGKGYSVQANLMEKPTVWPAMARAYEQSVGQPFAERLLLALEAAEREGGDVRGRQSAAILIVKGVSSGKPWADRILELRVEDNPAPLVELRRLHRLHQAYDLMNAGDEALAANKLEQALDLYSKGAALAPEISELPFWQAVTLFTSGHEQQALDLFGEVFAADPRWVVVVQRLPKVGLLPADEKKIRAILDRAPAKH